MFVQTNIKRNISYHWKEYVLLLVTLIIFLIPNLFWENLYIVGGDDTRLYYLFPFQYLTNYTLSIISHNALGGNLGYFPISYSIPVVSFLLTLKKLFPFANTQFVTYGLIFSFGFLFFYFFVQEWVPKKTTFYFWISIIASTFYIFSPYILRTYFQHQLLSIFLLMVLPGFLYFFVSGVKRDSVTRVILSSLLYSLFSSTVYSLPWFLSAIVTLIPFFIYLAVSYGKRFWKMVVIFLGLTILCNFYWMIHYIIPVIDKTRGVNGTSSIIDVSLTQQNDDLINALSYLNNPFHQMINYLRISWQDRQGATPWQVLGGMTYLAVILFAGSIIQKIKKHIRILYLLATTGLLLTMLFITPNFGLWNVRLFQFASDHIPLFVIFRNMYDKFALAMAFHWAFSLFVALVVLAEAKTDKIGRYVCIIVLFAVALTAALPYIHPTYNDNTVSTRISGLNKDFLDLTAYIKGLNTTSRFVWFPMTFAGYTYISDEVHPNHYYEGLSPLQIFAGASDLAGFYGLRTSNEPDLNWTVLNLLKQRNYQEVGNIFKRLNVGYIIVNHEQVPQDGPFVLEQFDFVKYQNKEYLVTILGEKIRDFGKRYSLYSINEQYRLPTVFLSSDTKDVQATHEQVEFRKARDGAYEIGPFAVAKETNFILMEPYSPFWSIERLDGYKHATIQNVSRMAYGYGNAWILDPAKLGSPTVRVRIEFWPNKLIMPSLIVSGVSAVVALFYCIAASLRKKKAS